MLKESTVRGHDISGTITIPASTKKVWLEPSESDHVPSHAQSTPTPSKDSSTPLFFPVVASGGTFDHLHAGHKILLSMAAWIAKAKLIVGVTGPHLPLSFWSSI